MSAPRGLSSGTMNLKFMQRNKQPTATSQDEAKKENINSTPANSQPSGSTSNHTLDPFPSSSSFSSKLGKDTSSKDGTARKIIIEPGYAPFPPLINISRHNKKALTRGNGVKVEDEQKQENAGRQSFGQTAAPPKTAPAKGKAPAKKEESEDDETLPSSSDDEAPNPPPPAASKRQRSDQKQGFQKPSGFSDVKKTSSKGKPKQSEDDSQFVDDMIEGARAKRVKTSKQHKK